MLRQTKERRIVWDGDGTKCVREGAAILTIAIVTLAFTLENIIWKLNA